MAAGERYTDPEGGFEAEVPPGWWARPDAEQGGVELAAGGDGAGVLHLLAVPQPEGSFPDAAEELYAFLDEQGIELSEDDVEDLELAGGAELTLCEYEVEAEEDEQDEPTFWLVGVATAPGQLVFATYVCAAAEADQERDVVRGILASLRLIERG